MKRVFWSVTFLLIAGAAFWIQAPPRQFTEEKAKQNTPQALSPSAEVAEPTPAEPLATASQEELERLALNINEQGDTRAEAIEKLSRKPNDHSLQTLTELAARNLPKSGGGLFVAQERVFAAMAIEGILNHPSKDQKIKSIETILRAQNDQFIITRANMALGFVKGLTPHPKDIDEKNLTNLFE